MATDPTETGVNLGAIFKLLEQSDNQAKANNPFASTTQGINGIDLSGASTALDPFTGKLRYSPGQQIVGGLLKGLAGGLSQGFQDQYQQGQQEKASNFLLGALKGGDTTTMPEGMNPSIFNNLKNAASIFQLEKGAQAQNEQEALKKMALEKYFEKNSDAAAQYAQTGVLNPTAGSGTKSGYSSDFLTQNKIPLDVDKAEADKRLGMATEVIPTVHDQIGGLGKIRQSILNVLPIVSKINAAIDPNSPITNLADLSAKGIISTNDMAQLTKEVPMIAAAVASSDSKRLPKEEMKSIGVLLGGPGTIARGDMLKELNDIYNRSFQGPKSAIESYLGNSKYDTDANNLLKNPLLQPQDFTKIAIKLNPDVQKMMSSPDTTPQMLLGVLKIAGASKDLAKELYDQKFGN